MRFAHVAVVVAACSPSGRGSDGHGADAAGISRDAAGDAAPFLCYAPSEMGKVTPGTSTVESCAIWNDLAVMNGMVTVTRSGDALTITFGNGPVSYTGTVTDGAVELVYSTLHDFEDGCKWRATETLKGTLDETSCMLALSYTYRESVEIDNGGCAMPCSADGSFAFAVTPIVQ